MFAFGKIWKMDRHCQSVILSNKRWLFAWKEWVSKKTKFICYDQHSSEQLSLTRIINNSAIAVTKCTWCVSANQAHCRRQLILQFPDWIQFYCRVSRIIWTRYHRSRGTMLKCDALCKYSTSCPDSYWITPRSFTPLGIALHHQCESHTDSRILFDESPGQRLCFKLPAKWLMDHFVTLVKVHCAVLEWISPLLNQSFPVFPESQTKGNRLR